MFLNNKIFSLQMNGSQSLAVLDKIERLPPTEAKKYPLPEFLGLIRKLTDIAIAGNDMKMAYKINDLILDHIPADKQELPQMFVDYYQNVVQQLSKRNMYDNLMILMVVMETLYGRSMNQGNLKKILTIGLRTMSSAPKDILLRHNQNLAYLNGVYQDIDALESFDEILTTGNFRESTAEDHESELKAGKAEDAMLDLLSVMSKEKYADYSILKEALQRQMAKEPK